jgi:carbamoyltransferase
MKKILGISAFYHDSAAAIVIDGKVLAAAQEERFTRQKHTPDFPINSIKFCLEESGYSLYELDAISLADVIVHSQNCVKCFLFFHSNTYCHSCKSFWE